MTQNTDKLDGATRKIFWFVIQYQPILQVLIYKHQIYKHLMKDDCKFI